jgi:hypothetical protein
MDITRRAVSALVVFVIGAFIGAWASTQVSAQPVNLPIVLSGADLGFRVTERKGNAAVGELVVRINGEWRPAQFRYAARPLTK